MKESVYIETSVISYYTARPSRDLVVAARQEITRDGWVWIAENLDRYVSALVIKEAGQGDAEEAARRLDAVKGIAVLDIDQRAEDLAGKLTQEGPIPDECLEDALHIAVAATNGMDYLLTWDFSHINNAMLKVPVHRLVEECGYQCPVICSPDELTGAEP